MRICLCLFIILFLAEAAQAASRYDKRGLKYEVGEMHYAVGEWHLKYELKYNEYYETTKTLENYVAKLTKICKKEDYKLCKFFLGKTKQFQNDVKIDTEQLRLYRRDKRFLFVIPVLVVLGVTTMALLSSMKSERDALNQVKSELEANLDMLEKSINTTEKMLDIHEEIFDDFDAQRLNLEEAIQRLNKTVTNHHYFTNILHTITFLMMQHNKDQTRLLHLYDATVTQHIFSIVNYDEFLQAVKVLNKYWEPMYQAPPMELNMINFLKHSIDRENSLTTILLRVPKIRKEKNMLYEYIPIPFEEENELYILDMDATLYFKNDENEILIPPKLDRYCKTIENYTICRDIMVDALQIPTKCFSTLITHGITSFCVYKPIAKKNYAISISGTALYYYITEPTKLKLKCDNSIEQEINLEKSKLIEFSKDCIAFRDTENTKNVTERSEFKINFASRYPEIFEYDVPSQTWTPKITIVDKYKLKLLETKTEFDKINTDIKDHREIINKIEFNTGFFDSILGFFNLRDLIPVKYFEIFFYFICVLMAAYIFKICILPLFKCKSKS